MTMTDLERARAERFLTLLEKILAYVAAEAQVPDRLQEPKPAPVAELPRRIWTPAQETASPCINCGDLADILLGRGWYSQAVEGGTFHVGPFCYRCQDAIEHSRSAAAEERLVADYVTLRNGGAGGTAVIEGMRDDLARCPAACVRLLEWEATR